MHQLNVDSMDVTRGDLPLVVAYPSYIAGLRFATGAGPEGKARRPRPARAERHFSVLDLAIANTIEGHDTTRELGGDLVTRPSEDQQQAITEIRTAGYSS